MLSALGVFVTLLLEMWILGKASMKQRIILKRNLQVTKHLGLIKESMIILSVFPFEKWIYVVFVLIKLKDAVSSNLNYAVMSRLLPVRSSLVKSSVTVFFFNICSFFLCYEGSDSLIW